MTFDPEQIRHTLSTILHTQGRTVAAELLDTARVEISYVNSDFGEDFYSFDLRIPPVRFAQIEDQIDRHEKLISEKMWKLGIKHADGTLNQVRIYPEPVLGAGAIGVLVPTLTDEKRIWAPGRIRLFLSHLARVKVRAAEIKQSLAPLGIDAFVAHEDIEPTREWRREIELALRSMDVLCALVTEGFVNSLWTDQEVGFALGRALPVIAVRCGADPHGLLGKDQAVPGDLSKPAECATKIADIIARQEHLRPRFMEALVDSVATAISYRDAKEGMKRIDEFKTHLSDAQVVRLLKGVLDNSQVRDAINVPNRINQIATARKISLPPVEAKVDFDDDIPF